MNATELLSCLTIGALTLVLEQLEAHHADLTEADAQPAELNELRHAIDDAKLLLRDKTNANYEH